MNTIGLFYGSDTGYTEDIAKRIVDMWDGDTIDLYDIRDAAPPDIAKYDRLIIGSSTWNDGELVSGWYDFFPQLDNIDFTGKIIALFGNGDQMCYGSWYNDAIGILGKKMRERGAMIVGRWPNDGYTFDESVAIEEDGYFIGLALDETNQADQTDRRLGIWLTAIKKEFQKKDTEALC